jgi:NADH dehydrogenase
LLETDIQGTQSVAKAAREAGVDRLFYLSHLGADRASAYPVLKAKAIAEEHVRRSGIDYTILRSALVYGPQDGFTTGLARLLHSLPGMFLIPGDGSTLLQPIWIEDLVTALTWALDDSATRSQTYEIGGPEYLSFRSILQSLMEELGLRRMLVNVRPPYLRGLTVFLEHTLPGLPVSVFWLDYLASNHTGPLDTLPHAFNLMPARFSHRLAYLKGQNWRTSLARSLMGRG